MKKQFKNINRKKSLKFLDVAIKKTHSTQKPRNLTSKLVRDKIY